MIESPLTKQCRHHKGERYGAVHGRRFAGHVGTVYSAVFAPDGDTIVTGADDGRLLTWELSIDRCAANLSARLLRDFTADEQAQFGIAELTSAS